MTNAALEALARGIAIGAHAGQLDKAGLPYIRHPERIAARCSSFTTRVLAWLHDTVEDTPLQLDDLAAAGFPENIVLMLDALTHRPNEPRDAYYKRILEWPEAVEVKLLDIDDNSNESRLEYLDAETQARLRRKYAKARAALGRTPA